MTKHKSEGKRGGWLFFEESRGCKFANSLSKEIWREGIFRSVDGVWGSTKSGAGAGYLHLPSLEHYAPSSSLFSHCLRPLYIYARLYTGVLYLNSITLGNRLVTVISCKATLTCPWLSRRLQISNPLPFSLDSPLIHSLVIQPSPVWLQLSYSKSRRCYSFAVLRLAPFYSFSHCSSCESWRF